MEQNKDYKKGFIPYALAAFLIGIVGGFSTVLGPSFVQDIGIAYNNTTWTALAQAMSTAACAPILGKVGDVVKYQPKNSDFDFITLMDVIEHIPLDQHEKLFENLANIATEKTQIAINIPNPQYIEYTRKHNPESLQVIDQEVELFPLVSYGEKFGLELVFFQKYGIWEEEDYHFMVFRKKRKFELKHLAEKRNVTEKIAKKVSNKIDEIKYK